MNDGWVFPKADSLKPFKPINLDQLHGVKSAHGGETPSINGLLKPSTGSGLDTEQNTKLTEPGELKSPPPDTEFRPSSTLLNLGEKPQYEMPDLPKDLTTSPNVSTIGVEKGDQLFLSVNLSEGGFIARQLIMDGPQGEIWLVIAPDGTQCALKILDLSRFLSQKQADKIAKNQISAYQRLQDNPHPNVVKSLATTLIPNPINSEGDPENSTSLPVVLLERLEGDKLNNQDLYGFDLETKISIIKQIASGIDHLHKNLILHCQLSPDSIIVGSGDINGKNRVVKIAELGFAVNPDQSKGIFAGFMGFFDSPYTSANLRSGGDPSVKDDLISYAAVVFYTLTGHAPFISSDLEGGENNKLENLRDVNSSLTQLTPNQVRRLNELFADILCFNGSEKYNSAEEIAESIERIFTEKEETNLLSRLINVK